MSAPLNREVRLLMAVPMRLEAAIVSSAVRRALLRRTGMGPQNSLGAADALRALPGGALVVVGFCGALGGDLRPGEVVVGERVWAARDEPHRQLEVSCAGVDTLLEALRESGLRARRGGVVSVGKLALGERRDRLRQEGAIAVDMESAWLSAGAGDRPFAVVRVVLDTPEQELLRPRMLWVGVQVGAVLRRAARAVDEAVGDRCHTLLPDTSVGGIGAP